MLNIKYNDIKKTKKQYTSLLKTTNACSYKLHEKMASSLNQSIISDTTTSKTYIAKNLVSNFPKQKINENDRYHIKKCSYVDFLELRRTKNTLPFGYREKRFKWQNLNDKGNFVDPLIYKRLQRKKVNPSVDYGEGILNFIFNRKEPPHRKKGKKIKRVLIEQSNSIREVNVFPKYSDFNYSRRVLEPELNQDIPIVSRKKAFSQTKYMFHKTNGNIRTLFETTPWDIPPTHTKKLYKNKSYAALTINIFDNTFSQYQLPTHTKKLFLDNKCHTDHISNEELITEMDDCWKRRGKNDTNFIPMTRLDFSRSMDMKYLRLRNYYRSYISKTKGNNSLSRIKRKIYKL